MESSLSPEPGSFPKRRVARLTVPPADAEHQAPGIPSCHSDAPSVLRPPSASPRRPPFRLSKPGYQAAASPQLYQSLLSIFMLLLLVGVVSMSSYKARQLKAVVSALEQKHKVRPSDGSKQQPEAAFNSGCSSVAQWACLNQEQLAGACPLAPRPSAASTTLCVLAKLGHTPRATCAAVGRHEHAGGLAFNVHDGTRAVQGTVSTLQLSNQSTATAVR